MEERDTACHRINALPKTPSGIRGFDDITFGGLPQGRPTLVCGSAGSGKTLFGMEFLVRGAIEFDEPGVFISFEESEKDLIANFASLGFDLKNLQENQSISLDYVHIDRSEIHETGEYDLEGLFVRLGLAVDSIGAKRVVLDTLEALFAGFANEAILRSEIRRLFRWLKDRGLTAVITAERGNRPEAITRHGLEEYVSDCVIILDHRVTEQISTRRLRVMKYRGSVHGTNEYPFLIDEGGFSVLPITSVDLGYEVSSERLSTGIARLDTMLAEEGYYRGSSILLSGTAGTGKTSMACLFANNVCNIGERCLYYAFEESSHQIMRNMKSIGIDLKPFIDQGLLRFEARRPTYYGLEMHLTIMYKIITAFQPSTVILDPISNLTAVGDPVEVKMVLMRLVDLLKSKQITSLFTNLIHGGVDEIESGVGVSSLIDTWILIQDIETGGEQNRCLRIVKSRGMKHSNQVREFLLTDKGVDLVDIYTGPEGLLTGTARIAREAAEKAESLRHEQEIEHKKTVFERKRLLMESRIALLQSMLEAESEEIERSIMEHETLKKATKKSRNEIAAQKMADKTGENLQ